MATEKSQMLFSILVSMLNSQAMTSMGKLKNPVTDSVERDLATSQIMIDLLDMIRERTVGNLSEDESRFLEHTLSDLRLNYVVEANKEKNPASPESTHAEETGPDESGIPPNVA